jgi:hypothetical protein
MGFTHILSSFIHIIGKLFHTALYPPILERISQVASIALPGPEQVRQSAQQVATRVSHLASDAKGTTQQAMNKVKHTGSDLAEKAKQLTLVGNQNGR